MVSVELFLSLMLCLLFLLRFLLFLPSSSDRVRDRRRVPLGDEGRLRGDARARPRGESSKVRARLGASTPTQKAWDFDGAGRTPQGGMHKLLSYVSEPWPAGLGAHPSP